MWIVARHTVESVVTLGEAAAPRQGGALKANCRGIVARDDSPARAVALGAEFHSPYTGGQGRASDRQVRKSSLDRHEVVAARPVTPLAADPPVGRYRSRAFDYRSMVGDVAEQTPANAVFVQRPSEILVKLARPLGMPRGHVPAGAVYTS